jgi:hypothetical protein
MFSPFPYGVSSIIIYVGSCNPSGTADQSIPEPSFLLHYTQNWSIFQLLSNWVRITNQDEYVYYFQSSKKPINYYVEKLGRPDTSHPAPWKE